MMHKAEKITSYRFKSSDELLLDTNIWLLVFGPQKPGDRRVAVYSEAFARILTAHCRIYIDVLIVSEFINTYARLKWRLTSYHVFKEFRKNKDFKPVAQNIAADIKRVLQHCVPVDDGFESVAIDALIDEYAEGDSDFNDQILAALCKRKGLTRITDDGDFKGHEILVVTANNRLLT